MARNSFNKKELRNAARIYAEKRLTALDSVLENQPVILSPIFRQSIASIRHRAEEASLKRQQVRKRVAVVCFIIILLVTAFFSFNETARAEFFNWIKSIYNEYIVYQFLGEKPSDELPDLTPEWLPDGVYMSKTEELALMMEEGAFVIQAHPYREAHYIDHIRS